MNKEELIKKIAESTSLTKDNASKALDAIFQTITESLKEKEPVTITGFGSFKVTNREARKGRNPRTGDTIEIAASSSPSFTASKVFKDMLKS